MAKNKIKYYVVWQGYKPGIYNKWSECLLQIKGYGSAKYKAFATKAEAEVAFNRSADDYYKKSNSGKTTPVYTKFLSEIESNSISVDAACSGNPGTMEYRGVITTTGEEIFKQGPYKHATNNIGEFLALVHALAFLDKQNRSDIIIYTDSRTGLSWVNKKKVKTTLKKTTENAVVFERIEKALDWLERHPIKNKIIKWNTKKWGEIPADFGRK